MKLKVYSLIVCILLSCSTINLTSLAPQSKNHHSLQVMLNYPQKNYKQSEFKINNINLKKINLLNKRTKFSENREEPNVKIQMVQEKRLRKTSPTGFDIASIILYLIISLLMLVPITQILLANFLDKIISVSRFILTPAVTEPILKQTTRTNINMYCDINTLLAKDKAPTIFIQGGTYDRNTQFLSITQEGQAQIYIAEQFIDLPKGQYHLAQQAQILQQYELTVPVESVGGYTFFDDSTKEGLEQSFLYYSANQLEPSEITIDNETIQLSQSVYILKDGQNLQQATTTSSFTLQNQEWEVKKHTITPEGFDLLAQEEVTILSKKGSSFSTINLGNEGNYRIQSNDSFFILKENPKTNKEQWVKAHINGVNQSIYHYIDQSYTYPTLPSEGLSAFSMDINKGELALYDENWVHEPVKASALSDRYEWNEYFNQNFAIVDSQHNIHVPLENQETTLLNIELTFAIDENQTNNSPLMSLIQNQGTLESPDYSEIASIRIHNENQIIIQKGDQTLTWTATDELFSFFYLKGNTIEIEWTKNGILLSVSNLKGPIQGKIQGSLLQGNQTIPTNSQVVIGHNHLTDNQTTLKVAHLKIENQESTIIDTHFTLADHSPSLGNPDAYWGKKDLITKDVQHKKLPINNGTFFSQMYDQNAQPIGSWREGSYQIGEGNPVYYQPRTMEGTFYRTYISDLINKHSSFSRIYEGYTIPADVFFELPLSFKEDNDSFHIILNYFSIALDNPDDYPQIRLFLDNETFYEVSVKKVNDSIEVIFDDNSHFVDIAYQKNYLPNDIGGSGFGRPMQFQFIADGQSSTIQVYLNEEYVGVLTPQEGHSPLGVKNGVYMYGGGKPLFAGHIGEFYTQKNITTYEISTLQSLSTHQGSYQTQIYLENTHPRSIQQITHKVDEQEESILFQIDDTYQSLSLKHINTESQTTFTLWDKDGILSHPQLQSETLNDVTLSWGEEGTFLHINDESYTLKKEGKNILSPWQVTGENETFLSNLYVPINSEIPHVRSLETYPNSITPETLQSLLAQTEGASLMLSDGIKQNNNLIQSIPTIKPQESQFFIPTHINLIGNIDGTTENEITTIQMNQGTRLLLVDAPELSVPINQYLTYQIPTNQVNIQTTTTHVKIGENILQAESHTLVVDSQLKQRKMLIELILQITSAIEFLMLAGIILINNSRLMYSKRTITKRKLTAPIILFLVMITVGVSLVISYHIANLGQYFGTLKGVLTAFTIAVPVLFVLIIWGILCFKKSRADKKEPIAKVYYSHSKKRKQTQKNIDIEEFALRPQSKRRLKRSALFFEGRPDTFIQIHEVDKNNKEHRVTSSNLTDLNSFEIESDLDDLENTFKNDLKPIHFKNSQTSLDSVSMTPSITDSLNSQSLSHLQTEKHDDSVLFQTDKQSKETGQEDKKTRKEYLQVTLKKEEISSAYRSSHPVPIVKPWNFLIKKVVPEDKQILVEHEEQKSNEELQQQTFSTESPYKPLKVKPSFLKNSKIPSSYLNETLYCA